MAYQNFESGVSSYIKGVAVVEVFFPVDRKGAADVSCRQCQYYQQMTRKCALNAKVVAYPDHYVGSHCPLQFDDGEEANTTI